MGRTLTPTTYGNRAPASSVLRTVGALVLWALTHSLLATRSSKEAVARISGQRNYQGLYRLAYNAIAVVSTLLLALYIRRLPDRTLYRIRAGWRVPITLLRLALLLVAGRATMEIGIGPFSGISEALAWLTGKRTFEAPEAQGPAADPVASPPLLKIGGPFRYVRHPLNASATAIIFLTPSMTELRLTLSLLTLLYSVIGSRLEERRLLEMYGAAYRDYLRSGVPFFIPRLGRPSPGAPLTR